MRVSFSVVTWPCMERQLATQSTQGDFCGQLMVPAQILRIIYDRERESEGKSTRTRKPITEGTDLSRMPVTLRVYVFGIPKFRTYIIRRTTANSTDCVEDFDDPTLRTTRAYNITTIAASCVSLARERTENTLSHLTQI